MKIHRKPADARNSLNFSQIKTAPSLQQERFKPFVDRFENQPVHKALKNAEDSWKNADYSSRSARESLIGWTIASLAGGGAGAWAGLSGHPLLAGGLALAATAAGGMGVRSYMEVKSQGRAADLAQEALQTMTQAADEHAATLLCEGPGPDQYTDKRYYTGGVIEGVATVHSRESGSVLRTQIDLGGSVPRRLEANAAKKMVSIRSAQGDQSFPGELKLYEQGFQAIAHATSSAQDGPISQEIYPDGESIVHCHNSDRRSVGMANNETVSSKSGYVAGTYVWENGQVATVYRDDLYVANPIVPFADLAKVRVLPDAVVGADSASDGTHYANEAVVPTTHGLGTWASVSDPALTARLVSTPFGAGFTAAGDHKQGTVKITAGDGSELETSASLQKTNGAYRLHTQHTHGRLEQSLLANEVLLTLEDGARTISVQHKSGSQPTASENKDEDFLSSGNGLPVSLDDTGIYWVGEGAARIDIKPLMPLTFLEKQASQVAKTPA